MAIFRSVMRFPIDGNRSLDVVLEDRNPQVIFTIAEKLSDSYRTRETFVLSDKAAMRLAMFLAGIENATNLTSDPLDSRDTTEDDLPQGTEPETE